MAINHRKMLASLQPGNSFSMTIYIPCFQNYPPPPPPPPQEDLSLLVSTLICVVGSVLLFLVLLVFLYLYITQRWRSSAAAVAPVGSTNRREDEEEGEERNFSSDHHVWRITTPGLHRSTINSITVVRFNKEEGLIDGTECSVCLNEFEQDESLRLLPKCSHAFHINCIDTWLLSHKNCPLCRSPVLLTEPPHQETQTNRLQDSESRNNLSTEEESPGSRNPSVLPRAQSDLANHCGPGNVETVRRSFSIGGSSSLKACDGATRSRRHFYSSFNANFFSSSRRTRNQDPVFPIRMPSTTN